jgi:arsenate reductase-like glutaredoxin family protein
MDGHSGLFAGPAGKHSMKTKTQLTEIEQLTRKYADAREELGDLIRAMEEKIDQIKRANLPRIRELVNRTAERQANLRAAIEDAPELFEKPRTQVYHGVKIGFRKGSGGIDWADDDQVVKLIEKHFPKEQAELLIKTVKKPIAKALEDLDVAELKKIGCTVESTGDVVVIKPVAGGVEKIVNALLKEAADLEAAAQN